MKTSELIGSQYFWLLLYIYICMHTLIGIYKVLLFMAHFFEEKKSIQTITLAFYVIYQTNTINIKMACQEIA